MNNQPTQPSGWSRPWHRIVDGYATLAQFASTKPLSRVGLAQHHQADVLIGGGPALVAHNLFRQLVDLDLGYNLDPWNSETGQLIRDPSDIRRGSGTCLDLALLYCAMAKDAGLRPYLVIAHGNTDHAFVVIDTMARAAKPSSAPLWAALEADVEVIEGGLCGRLDTVDLTGSLPGNWLPIDPSDACRSTALHPRSHNFDDTVSGASGHLLESFDRVVLIDVVGAHANGFPELEAREEAERPVIFRRVPTIVGYQEIPSRRKVIDDLAHRSGYVVLAGAPGVGKSLTAALVATAAAGGAGWFLNADDAATYKVELAEAAMGHLGLDPTGLDGNDIRAYANTAFEILHSASARWVVVLDNANRPPREYGRLPVPGPDQLVLITTTDLDAWSAWAENQRAPSVVDTIPALSPAERRDWPGAEMIDNPPDTPLLLNLAVRLAGRGALPDGRDTSTLVVAGLNACDDIALMSARSLSLLPPVVVPVETLTGDHGAGHRSAEALAQIGLIQRVDSDRVVMHRIIRATVRNHLADDLLDGRVLARLLSDASAARLFEAAAPVAELNQLADLLHRSGLPPTTVGESLCALGSFQERKDSKASAAWFEQALAHLPTPEAVTDARHAQLIASCLQGIARSAFRRPAAAVDEKREARQRLTPIYQMARRFPDDIPVQLAVSRADAMDALLRRSLAGQLSEPFQRRTELQAALDQLERSAERRLELVREATADIDRSRFNIPGTLIGLAKEGDPKEAERLLDRAESIYQEVHAVRARRYRTEESEEVITCTNGEAITNYYRAVLIPDLSAAERLSLLNRAFDQASEAMRVRQRLASPEQVSGDSIKSTTLATKALLLMQDLAETIQVTSADAFNRVLAEVTPEHERIALHLPELQ